MKATKYIKIDGKFTMHRGGELESPSIAYETWGELKGDGENAVIIFTGLSPSAPLLHQQKTLPAAGGRI